MKLGGLLPPPSHQLNLLSGKGGEEGVLLLRQVFLTFVSGKLNKSLEHIDIMILHIESLSARVILLKDKIVNAPQLCTCFGIKMDTSEKGKGRKISR